jgi:cellulose synthase/poly-beta-1,6-N-acetylglucosamine synthase-like glycosyltransferase
VQSSFPLLLTPQFRRRSAHSAHDTSAPLENLDGDPRGIDHLGWAFVLQHNLLPLIPKGAVTPVACADPHTFETHRTTLEAKLGRVAYCHSTQDVITAAASNVRGTIAVARAETSTPKNESCRIWSGRRAAFVASAVLGSLSLCAVLWPAATLLALTLWAVLTLCATTGLRTVAALVELRHSRRKTIEWCSSRSHKIDVGRLPRISLLVPLYKEQDIASELVTRLSAIDYPKDRLEVCLILENCDHQTAEVLAWAVLPDWMRIVRVPEGALRTKPRAMNFALDFTNGDIVGIFDAEDMPAKDQLRKVAAGFARAKPNVACLQGVLDFYNAKQNWLTRCFTIDYAMWFRLVLPGLVRLGIVIPLGGTTVFFRRRALEDLGRWDAHNVTEDADLGIRIARHGYRTAFVDSVTLEEATASVPAWVRQRSRWIKGYAMTWAVHMRDPLRLLGELGPWKFLGVQILFLGTLSQFVFAPLLWSFWLVPFGFYHPVVEIAPRGVVLTMAALFLLAEIATMAMSAFAVAGPRHRWLIKWVPVMHLYFPLAAVALWKGFAELFTHPFYWDKTSHGHAPASRTMRPKRWMRIIQRLAGRISRPLRRPDEGVPQTRD